MRSRNRQASARDRRGYGWNVGDRSPRGRSDAATRSRMPHVPLRRGARLTRDGHQVGDPRLPAHHPILVPKLDSTAGCPTAFGLGLRRGKALTVGVGGNVGGLAGGDIVLRWHPLYVIGLFVLPLCGAAVTFFAAAKKATKESSFKPSVPVSQALRRMAFELSHHSREHSGPTT
jgi:hypothetical protein